MRYVLAHWRLPHTPIRMVIQLDRSQSLILRDVEARPASLPPCREEGIPEGVPVSWARAKVACVRPMRWQRPRELAGENPLKSAATPQLIGRDIEICRSRSAGHGPLSSTHSGGAGDQPAADDAGSWWSPLCPGECSKILDADSPLRYAVRTTNRFVCTSYVSCSQCRMLDASTTDHLARAAEGKAAPSMPPLHLRCWQRAVQGFSADLAEIRLAPHCTLLRGLVLHRES